MLELLVRKAESLMSRVYCLSSRMLVPHDLLRVGIARAAATTALPLATSATFATLPSLKEWMAVVVATATGAVVAATATGVVVDIEAGAVEAAGEEGKEIGKTICF